MTPNEQAEMLGECAARLEVMAAERFESAAFRAGAKWAAKLCRDEQMLVLDQATAPLRAWRMDA